MKKLRVLHVITWLNHGGVETWLLRHLRSIQQTKRWHVDILCRGKERGCLANNAERFGAKVDWISMRLATRGNAKKLARHIQSGGYNVVHGHLNSHNSVVARAAKLANIPSIVMFHNERMIAQADRSTASWKRWLAQEYVRRSVVYTLRNATTVAPVSHAVAQVLSNYHAVPSERMQVAYLGTEPASKITEQEIRSIREKVFRCPADGKVILHVGSFSEQKNHVGLLTAFERLREQGTNAILALVGGGKLYLEIQARIESSTARPYIRCLGTRDDVERLMQSADCFFLPSHHEGLPIVLMEAFAAGLPVVASDIPSIREAFANPSAAAIAAPCNHAAFALLLRNVLTNSDHSAKMRTDGIERFANLFSIDASNKRMEDLYHQALESHLCRRHTQ
ncbi:Putative glycosyltransferase EpsF [Rosistilla ulvae]|uniref:Glycosyltransferase EpsF n=1 Tax=Rosistilla ulvae TaxID=1930277 RepID=A0A517LX73_9BACT|nr:glycosyltransferase [Rosistilla ulvae]QDS87231.1 Putative glycosyltransferase EpsF [Rosistilla ulvae]